MYEYTFVPQLDLALEQILCDYMQILVDNNIATPSVAYEGFMERVSKIKWPTIIDKLFKLVERFFKWIRDSVVKTFAILNGIDMYHKAGVEMILKQKGKLGSNSVTNRNVEYVVRTIESSIDDMTKFAKHKTSSDEAMKDFITPEDGWIKGISTVQTQLLDDVRKKVFEDNSKKAFILITNDSNNVVTQALNLINSDLSMIQTYEGVVKQFLRKAKSFSEIWDTTKSRYDNSTLLKTEKRLSWVMLAIQETLQQFQQCITCDEKILFTLVYNNSKDGVIYGMDEFTFEPV